MSKDEGKIAPIGGVHRSAKSLLAEAMNSPGLMKAWVVTMDENGDIGLGHYEMTRAETAYIGTLLQRFAFGDED